MANADESKSIYSSRGIDAKKPTSRKKTVKHIQPFVPTPKSSNLKLALPHMSFKEIIARYCVISDKQKIIEELNLEKEYAKNEAKEKASKDKKDTENDSVSEECEQKETPQISVEERLFKNEVDAYINWKNIEMQRNI